MVIALTSTDGNSKESDTDFILVGDSKINSRYITYMVKLSTEYMYYQQFYPHKTLFCLN